VYIVPRAKLGSQFGYYILTDKAAYFDPFSSYELKVQRNSEGRLIAPHRLSGLRVEGQPISMLVSRDSGGSESGPNWPDLWVYDDADLKAEVTEDPVSTSTIAGLAVSQAFHKDPKAGETFHNSSLKDRMKMVKKQIPIEDAQAAIGTGVDASLAAVARDQVASLWSTYARKLEDHEQWKKDPSLDSREPPTPDKKDFEAALGACEEASRTTAEGPAHNELSSELKWQKQLFATNGAAARSGHGADVSPGQGVAPSHRQ
jgi:hypothetical protein